MNPFDDQFWRMMREIDRLRRAEEMMGIDRNAVRQMQEFWRDHDAARRALAEISNNPSYNLALEGGITSPLSEAARAANLAAIEIFKTIQPRLDAAGQIEQISPGWTERLHLIKGLPDVAGKTALDAHMSRMIETSILAESSLTRFKRRNTPATTCP
jgi:hypothetical protein